MSFGGGGGRRPPVPAPSPISVEPQGGDIQEIQRRKSAMARSNTLLTRGLLFESPTLLYPRLFGKTRLGE